MTPLISEMVRLSPEPERATWFDLGELTRTENQRVPVEVIMHLPFDKTAIVGVDKDGAKFALWLVGGDGSVAVGGVTKIAYAGKDGHGAFGKYFDPFSYLQTPEGIRYYKGDSQIDEADVKQMFRMVCAAMLKINDCTECYQPTAKANSLTNKRRIAKGKQPLIYDWHTVKLEPNGPAEDPQGGTHATPRRHQCRGHWRNCKSGKRVWVKDCWKGDASKGTVFKDYKAATNDPVAA